MTKTHAFLFFIMLCVLILIIYATSLFALTIVYRLELIEQDLDFIMRRVVLP